MVKIDLTNFKTKSGGCMPDTELLLAICFGLIAIFFGFRSLFYNCSKVTSEETGGAFLQYTASFPAAPLVSSIFYVLTAVMMVESQTVSWLAPRIITIMFLMNMLMIAKKRYWMREVNHKNEQTNSS